MSLPPFLLSELTAHLDQFTAPSEDSRIFVGPRNGPLRRDNFTRAWRRATKSAGLTGFHFHDLRHTGNHIAAATGASLRELMGRMGYNTTRAALIYQHRTAERDCPGATRRDHQPIGTRRACSRLRRPPA